MQLIGRKCQSILKLGLKLYNSLVYTPRIFSPMYCISLYLLFFLFRQYTSKVEEKEKYNVQELITAKNSVVPYLTEQDILEVLFGPQSEMKP